MKPKSILLLTGGIALGMVLGLGLLRVLDGLANRNVELAIGKPAPQFDLQSLDGQQVQLANYRGRAVLVNFWATWCAPCKKEMPLFEARYQKYAPDLVVVGINLGESREQVQTYVDDLSISFPVLLEMKGKSSADYNISGYPTSFFIDAEGILRAVHIGEINASQLDTALAEVGVIP